MIFHLLLNSFLVFILLSLLIEFSISMLGIKNARLRYFCRLLPILKFPFDLIIFMAFDQSIFLNLNPFSCELQAQALLSTLFPTQNVVNIHPQIIPQYIANYIPFSLLTLLVWGSLSLSTCIFALKFMQWMHSRRDLKTLHQTAIPCNRTITNPLLEAHLKKSKALLLVSSQVSLPCASGLQTIFIPSSLIETLSQEEFEAVIAHELEHLRWKDPVLKFFSHLFCGVFWWIPTQWLLQKLEEDQEEASDATLSKYSIDPLALGSAVIKAIKNAKGLNPKMASVCSFISSKSSYEKRLKTLLNNQISYLDISKASLAVLLSLLAFISFWAC